MSNTGTIPRQAQGIVARKTDDGYILVPVTGNIADMTAVFTLNPTGAFIWDAIDGQNSVADIASLLTAEFDTDMSTALSDVTTFLANMKEYLIVE